MLLRFIGKNGINNCGKVCNKKIWPRVHKADKYLKSKAQMSFMNLNHKITKM